MNATKGRTVLAKYKMHPSENSQLSKRNIMKALQIDMHENTVILCELRKDVRSLLNASTLLNEQSDQLCKDNKEYIQMLHAMIGQRGRELMELRYNLQKKIAVIEQEGNAQVAVLEHEWHELKYESLNKEIKLKRLNIILQDLQFYSLRKTSHEQEVNRLLSELKLTQIKEEMELNEIKRNFLRKRHELEKDCRSTLLQAQCAARLTIRPFLAWRLFHIRAYNILLYKELHDLTIKKTFLIDQKKKLVYQKSALALQNDYIRRGQIIRCPPSASISIHACHN